MPMIYDDKRLAQLAGQGDQDAFARLVERYTGMVYHLAVQRVGNHHDAEEIAQAVFFKAWQALPNFRGDAAFSTWLYRMTVNAATDHLRQKGRRETPLSLDDPDLPQTADLSPGPAEAVQEAERREALNQAIHALPDQSRTVLLLREFEGLSYEEIAQALELPIGTVRSRLARARAALTKILLAQGNLWDEDSSNSWKNKEKGGTGREPRGI